MTLENLKQALGENNEELIKRLSFANKEVLENFSIDKDGNVLYNGEKIISDIKISEQSGNAIEQKADGIYVGKDKDLADKVNQIKQYQQYVNTELEYGEFRFWHTTVIGNFSLPINLKIGTSINANLVKKNGNIDKPILKAGKKYRLFVTMCGELWNCEEACLYANVYINNNIIGAIYLDDKKDNEASAHTTQGVLEQIIIPEQDSEVKIVLYRRLGEMSILGGESVVIIQEIGHETVIDPMEYVNDQQGLEDTPVGHILSYMGNTPPKHYLNCDGSTYDIIEYPYLAEHIREQFGSYNYFGGDGINTFAVPDLRGEFLRGTDKNGAAVGEHQDGTRMATVSTGGNDIYAPKDAWRADTNVENFTECGCMMASGYSCPVAYTGFGTYTTRPTNTSVMYCIKYEPTYYFQHTTHTTENVVKEITTVQEISSLEYLQKHADLESGEPVGHILSYMGKTAPKHYLACDGAVYNISEYPLLAEHIKSNFGKYDYFGGNGTTTFAVPDLKGEFLRGTGLNSHTGNGNGAGVGSHQDASILPNYAFGTGGVNQSVLSVYTDRDKSNNTHNLDSAILQGTLGAFTLKADVDFSATIGASANQFTVRPTSTSVLWCIKYEPTYAFCEPIEHDNKEILDKFTEGEEGLLYDGKKIATDIEISKSDGNTLQKKEDGLFVPTPPVPETHSNKDTLDKFSESEGKLLYNGSEVSSETKVSEDEDNAIQKKDDGLFVPIPDLSKEGIEKSIEAANNDKGIEEAPVGHILAYMGNILPKHYLNCDGTVYNISEYSQLAEHIKANFGSYNYFGGNGTTTFAVPDLRGEFIRGAGINSRAKQGSGSAVGVHQNATLHQAIGTTVHAGNNSGQIYIPNLQNASSKQVSCLGGNCDSRCNTSILDSTKPPIDPIKNAIISFTTLYEQESLRDQALFTSRPTNTSVRFCIKYESTYCLNFSYTEQITKETTNEVTKEVRNYVGRGEEDLLVAPVAIPRSSMDGSTVSGIATLTKPIDEFDEIEIIISNGEVVAHSLTMSQTRKVSDIKSHYGLRTFYMTKFNKSDNYLSVMYGFSDNQTLGCHYLSYAGFNLEKWKLVHVYGIKYAKIGDDEISDEELQKAINDTIAILRKE